MANSVPSLSAVNFADAEITNPLAELAIPAARTTMIRAPDSEAGESEKFSGSESEAGDPLNILAFSASPAPMMPTLSIPPGNQIGLLPEMGFGGGTGSGAGTAGAPGASGQGKEGGTGNEAGGGTGRYGAGTGSSMGPGSGSGAPGPGVADSGGGSGGLGSGIGGLGGGIGGSGGNGGGTGMGSPGGTLEHSAFGLAEFAPLPGLPDITPPARIIHPENGVYDVVVVQTTPLDGLIENRSLLTGQPIYMVYIPVGMEREWVMQYCKPGSAPQQRGSVIQLGNPAPLKAPYPRITLIPSNSEMPTAGRLIFHGFLSDAGRFQNLERVRGEREKGERIQSYLKEWEFRPATQDGVPVRVEILLVIPPPASASGD